MKTKIRPEYGNIFKKIKIQKLVLLRNVDKQLRNPSLYRSLYMLDSLGKLFECNIIHSLTKRINELGDLSLNQNDFLKRRSVKELKNGPQRIIVQLGLELL